MDNYNYPYGADTPNAPWNQEDIPERKFTAYVTETLGKNYVSIYTDQYDVNCYKDEEGCACVEINTDNVDWEGEYTNNQHYTPSELINILSKLCDKILTLDSIQEKERLYYQNIKKECENWDSEEFTVFRDDNT